jgi:hypothetical protein
MAAQSLGAEEQQGTAAANAVAAQPTESDLLELWNSNRLPFSERDALLERIEQAGLLPRIATATDEWERAGGLYPDTEDPRFIEKLMAKQEFAESRQESIKQQKDSGVDPCNQEFELTPVQRFMGRFLSPQCPYTSALLFHGVGVGKTCAAITIAENYLRAFPRKSVFIVAPRNIQPGFRQTIFNDDDDTLMIPEEEDVPNEAKGCTGSSYLKRTGMEFEKDRAKVVRTVRESVASRYTFMGYIQFYNHIQDILKDIPKTLDEETYKAQRTRRLRREFSGRLVIIDEAHNLRDTPGEVEGDNRDNPGGEGEVSESTAGKRLTPALERVLDSADGMKLVLLTGTPMYNSYKEIVFLMNLLLRNDKKALISERDIFTPQGEFRPAVAGGRGPSRSGQEILGGIASAYVSFMRGENPLSFPVRLKPQGVPSLEEWPGFMPTGAPIPDEASKEGEPTIRQRMLKLPFVPLSYEGESIEEYKQLSDEIVVRGGIGINSIDEMVQAGNWLFPTGLGRQSRDTGFDACFEATGGRDMPPFQVVTADAKWLLAEQLGTTSPKAKFIIQRAAGAKGPIFVYSRFIKSGALPLALALEANGYVPWDRRPMLVNGVQDGLGGQCALCSRRSSNHGGADHRFVQAKYCLITGRAAISPKNKEAIRAARGVENKLGAVIKVVIGSQVASEGVDFRFIRELHLFDSWFHLNKMEQVLGRGVRFCSHSLLDEDKRNCTVHLLVHRLEGEEVETADLYMYREAMVKALQVGRVTRVLKEYAIDCNLNRDAIIVSGLLKQTHTDSQGVPRGEIDVNDTPFTYVCDWIECDYSCAKPVDGSDTGVDLSTYSEYAARWHEADLKRAIRALFETRAQPVFQLEEILDMMSAVPARAIQGLLAEIVGNQAFRLRLGNKEGYVVYRNGYYMFQPDYLSDIRAPLALRVADVPVKRDSFLPMKIETERGEAAAAAAEGVAKAAIRAAVGVGAEAAAEAAEAAPAAAVSDSLLQFWAAIKQWALEIAAGSAIRENIPPACCEAIDARFSGDERTRERERLIMVNWLYDHIVSSEEYTEENKRSYLRGLSDTLLEFVWDESFRPLEQRALLEQGGDDTDRLVGREQTMKKGSTTVFRFVDAITGVTRYMCGEKECFESVAREFERDSADPLNALKADRTTTGRTYGFMVPKAKEGRLVFKTSDAPPEVGKLPEKGKECTIVSTISYHITDLKAMAEVLRDEGYPKFILTEDVLDEKARRRREKEEAKIAGRKGVTAVVEKKVCGSREPNAKSTRSFENSTRACALKDIILRWLDAMIRNKGPAAAAAGGVAGRRYFYRPIAAAKTKHKGTVTKA